MFIAHAQYAGTLHHCDLAQQQLSAHAQITCLNATGKGRHHCRATSTALRRSEAHASVGSRTASLNSLAHLELDPWHIDHR